MMLFWRRRKISDKGLTLSQVLVFTLSNIAQRRLQGQQLQFPRFPWDIKCLLFSHYLHCQSQRDLTSLEQGAGLKERERIARFAKTKLDPNVNVLHHGLARSNFIQRQVKMNKKFGLEDLTDLRGTLDLRLNFRHYFSRGEFLAPFWRIHTL